MHAPSEDSCMYILRKKNVIERMCLCALLFVYLLCGLRLQVCAQEQIEDYALEIATVQAQQCAADLVQGLIARGYDAYSIPYRSSKGNKNTYFRIRIGKFQDVNYARRYGESLLSTGLLDTCAVTTYESPLTTLDKIINSITGEVSLRRIDVKTKLTDKFNVSCPVELMSYSNTPDIVGKTNTENLLLALDRNTWAVSADRGVLYSAPRSIPARFLSNNADATVDNDVLFSMRSLARTSWRLSTDPKLLDIAASNIAKSRNRPTQTAAPNNVANNAVNSNNSDVVKNNNAVSRAVSPTVSVAKASPPPVVAVAEKNVRPLPPTVSQPPTTSRSVPVYDSGPPKIQGFVEQRNGRMLLHIINSDTQRLFTGSARVTLSDERVESELSPQVFRLNPNEEKIIELKSNALMSHGDWMLMVFDDRKAIQLIRSAPFGNKPGQSGNNSGIMNTIISALDQTQVDDKKDELVSWAEDDDGSVKGGGDNSKDNAITQDLINQLKQNGETNKQDREQNRDTNKQVQVQVNITRLSTTDKGTLVDMNIISSIPVGNARILFQSGAFRDDRAVILSSLTARIPFFIPIAITTNECTYIIKDDSNNILASGSARY